MRRFQALLIAAGLAAAPASAAAGTTPDSTPPPASVTADKGRLGVLVMSPTPELRLHMGSTRDAGLLVARVEPGTPAAAAGITVGDLIVDVKGRDVDTVRDLIAALAPIGKNQSTSIGLLRDKKPITVQVTLKDEPRDVWSGFPIFNQLMRSFFEPIGPARDAQLRT
jgi:predicted metalloprotease with PDZ domain